MSWVPLGKVLLRNVIRHTDAHNKIQEESEMWKIREMEKQIQDTPWSKKRKIFPDSSGSRMRSDGFDEEAAWKARDLSSASGETEEDLRHARYWNKKLYECESNMPDRWGHSGYKELYPEEFDSDSDPEQPSVNGKRKAGKPSPLELPKRKKAKKSHKKKQKKKSHKKRKKKKREEASAEAESSPAESDSSEENVGKRKQKHRRKARKASARASASPSARGSDLSKADSDASGSSGDSEAEKPEKLPKKKRRKRRSPASERGGERVPEKRSKRKNWKVAADEKSEDSSDED